MSILFFFSLLFVFGTWRHYRGLICIAIPAALQGGSQASRVMKHVHAARTSPATASTRRDRGRHAVDRWEQDGGHDQADRDGYHGRGSVGGRLATDERGFCAMLARAGGAGVVMEYHGGRSFLPSPAGAFARTIPTAQAGASLRRPWIRRAGSLAGPAGLRMGKGAELHRQLLQIRVGWRRINWPQHLVTAERRPTRALVSRTSKQHIPFISRHHPCRRNSSARRCCGGCCCCCCCCRQQQPRFEPSSRGAHK